MTDLEYVVRCCREHAEHEAELLADYESLAMQRDEATGRYQRRCDALIKLCTERKPRSRTAKQDSELIALLKEYPI